MYSPILVLGYNRPDHLRRALVSLTSNVEASKSDVFIVIDGPKGDFDLSLVMATREVACQEYGFGSTKVILGDINKGLARSVIDSVTQIIGNHGKIIVIEDDLVLSPNFLSYMNQALTYYENKKKVASILGYQYPIRFLGNRCLFLRGTDCWGWATWEDRWRDAEFDPLILLQNIQASNLGRKFNLYGAAQNTRMLQMQINGQIDSWAIRWHASSFSQNMVSLFPPESLVLNTGLDGSGTHEGNSRIFESTLSTQQHWIFSQEIKESIYLRNRLIFYFTKSKIFLYLQLGKNKVSRLFVN